VSIKKRVGKCPVCGKSFLYVLRVGSGSKALREVVHDENTYRRPFPYTVVTKSCPVTTEHLVMFG
jgi:hypothetical protein